MVPASQSTPPAEPDIINADAELGEMKPRQHLTWSADRDGHRDRIGNPER